MKNSLLLNMAEYDIIHIQIIPETIMSKELIQESTKELPGKYFFSKKIIEKIPAHWKSEYGTYQDNLITNNESYLVKEGKLYKRPYLLFKFKKDNTFSEYFDTNEEMEIRINELQLTLFCSTVFGEFNTKGININNSNWFNGCKTTYFK